MSVLRADQVPRLPSVDSDFDFVQEILMFIRSYSHHFKTLCLLISLSCFLTGSSLAQEAANKRGFQPGNSFAIGDFETINTTNGNLILRFPLGGPPAGRNG
jgi:hypothetical protein